jgi:hypothetical protein
VCRQFERGFLKNTPPGGERDILVLNQAVTLFFWVGPLWEGRALATVQKDFSEEVKDFKNTWLRMA